MLSGSSVKSTAKLQPNGVLYPVTLGYKVGFIDNNGALIIEPTYEDSGLFVQDSDLAPVKLNGKWGYINKRGTMIVPPTYLSAKSFELGLGLAQVGLPDSRGYAYINRSGAVVIPYLSFVNSTVAFNSPDELVPFCDNTKDKNGICGYINKDGQITIPAQFEWAGRFNATTGLARVRIKDKKICWINRNGHIVRTLPYDAYTAVGDSGLGLVCNNGAESTGNSCGLIDKEGNVLIPLTYSLVVYEESDSSEKLGLYVIRLGDYFSVCDKKGKIVYRGKEKYCCPKVYDRLGDVAVFRYGLKLGLIDPSAGKVLLDPTYSSIRLNFNHGLAAASNGHAWGYIDRTGKTVIEFKYGHASDFGDESGLAVVDDDWDAFKAPTYYINTKGEKVPDEIAKPIVAAAQIKQQEAYTKAHKVSEFDKEGNPRIFYFKDESSGKFGASGVGKNCDTVYIAARYDRVDTDRASLGLVPVVLNGKCGYVNLQDQLVIPAIFDSIPMFTTGWTDVPMFKSPNDLVTLKLNNQRVYVSARGEIFGQSSSDCGTWVLKDMRGNTTWKPDNFAQICRDHNVLVAAQIRQAEANRRAAAERQSSGYFSVQSGGQGTASGSGSRTFECIFDCDTGGSTVFQNQGRRMSLMVTASDSYDAEKLIKSGAGREECRRRGQGGLYVPVMGSAASCRPK